MSMNVTSAIQAYQAAASSVRRGEAEAPQEKAATGGFADMVKASLEQSAAVLHKGEEMTLKGIAGEADMRDVVLAVNNAENTLSTVVAVRDKVITAYQEILKMPI